MTVSKKSLTSTFVMVDTTTGATTIGDSFTLDFASNTVTNGASGSSGAARASRITTPAKAIAKKGATKAPAKKGLKKAATKSVKKGTAKKK